LVFDLDGKFTVLEEGFQKVYELGGDAYGNQFEDETGVPDFVEGLLDV
jgi:hypothetical protein